MSAPTIGPRTSQPLYTNGAIFSSTAADPGTSSTLIYNRHRTLSTYRAALTSAQNQVAALLTTIAKLQSTLKDVRADEEFWKERVKELDRRSRVQALELAAANRGRREAEQECASVRVELERLKRDIGVVPVIRDLGVGIEGRKGVRECRCDCEAVELLDSHRWAGGRKGDFGGYGGGGDGGADTAAGIGMINNNGNNGNNNINNSNNNRGQKAIHRIPVQQKGAEKERIFTRCNRSSR
jgi:hypothetical protein